MLQKQKPSYYARLGHPSCSCFRKTELESLALAYVTALSHLGDSWTLRPSPTEVVSVLDLKKIRYHTYLRLLARRDECPSRWDCVTSKLRDQDGANDVWGFFKEVRDMKKTQDVVAE